MINKKDALSIGSISLGMQIEQVYEVYGKPTAEILANDGTTIFAFKPSREGRPETDDLVVRTGPPSDMIVRVSGQRLEKNGISISGGDLIGKEVMHSSFSQILREKLGEPEKILETDELGAEYWLYQPLNLQVWLSPGTPPSFFLMKEFSIPEFSVHQSQLDEYEYNLAAGFEVDWVPNPRAKVKPYPS